jgi:hypothetical protein
MVWLFVLPLGVLAYTEMAIDLGLVRPPRRRWVRNLIWTSCWCISAPLLFLAIIGL